MQKNRKDIRKEKTMRKKLVLVMGVLLLGITGCGNTTESESGETSDKISENKQEDEATTSSPKKEYTIKINGVEYDFPMTYQEFADMGWKNYYDETGNTEKEEGIDPDGMEGGMFYNNGDIVALEFVYHNPSDSFATYENCMVVGVRLSYSQTLNGQDDAEDVVVIPNGSIVINDELAIGESTREDVHTLLGPDWSEGMWDNVDYTTLETMMYYFDEESDVNNMVTFSFTDNIFDELNYIKLNE